MNNKKKKIVASLLVFFCALAIPGIWGSAAAEEWQARWKFATLAPDGVGWAKQMKEILLPAIDDATEKDLTVKVYWGGIMGDDEDYIKKMRIGQLHGAGLSGQGVALAVPEMAVLELPFLFDNYDEVDYVKTQMQPIFDEIAQKNGYMNLANIDEDICRVYSINYDMTKLEHFKKARVLSWFGPVEGETYQKLSAVPVSVNLPEAPTSLRQKVGDTIIASAIWMVGTQLYSTVKYASSYNVRYAPALIVVTQETWKTLPKLYQDRYYVLRDDVIKRFAVQVRAANDRCLKAMLNYGIKENAILPGELAAMRQKTKPLYEEGAGTLYPKELLDQVLATLAEYRAKQT